MFNAITCKRMNKLQHPDKHVNIYEQFTIMKFNSPANYKRHIKYKLKYLSCGRAPNTCIGKSDNFY